MELNYLTAKIDISAIVNNCRVLRPSGKKLCVAIKANAYGHGVSVILPAMIEADADMLSVATIEEAMELRKLKWTKPILIFGSEFSVYPLSIQQELADEIVKNEFRLTLTRLCDAEILNQAAERLKKNAYIHLDFDSGMSRMGLCRNELLYLVDAVKKLSHLSIEGLYTHFATADSADKTFALTQLQRFNQLIAEIQERKIIIPIIHSANSAATVDLSQSYFTMVRPGISVYGYSASNEMTPNPRLKPSMKLSAKITLIKNISEGSFVGYGCTFKTARPTTIGIVPIGYADGYSRDLSNRSVMTIHGRHVPVIGRVSMDQTIVDLTDVFTAGKKIEVGEEIIVYDNHRESPNSVESIADMLNTIPYVITTSLGSRVKREVLKNEKKL
jgi:alanine racemase